MTAVSDAGDGGEAGVSEAGVRDAHHQGGRAGAKNGMPYRGRKR